jgi:hypothetical protein
MKSKKHTADTAALSDVLDRLLETGAVVKGDVMVSLAGIDLLYLGVNLVATSISKMMESQGFTPPEGAVLTPEDTIYLEKLQAEIDRAQLALSQMEIGDSREEIEKGMARLVLTVVELIRRLMEKESMRQLTCGYLTEPQAQKLGISLKALSLTMERMKKTFGLSDEEINLDLGPLGSLF